MTYKEMFVEGVNNLTAKMTEVFTPAYVKVTVEGAFPERLNMFIWHYSEIPVADWHKQKLKTDDEKNVLLEKAYKFFLGILLVRAYFSPAKMDEPFFMQENKAETYIGYDNLVGELIAYEKPAVDTKI